MRKFYLLFLSAFMLSITVGATGLSSDFSYNKEGVTEMFSDLNELESYVSENEGVTLQKLMAEGNQVLSGMQMGASSIFGAAFAFGEPPLGIPSFLWGCVFGVAGVAIVYFVADDEDETKKAFKGCVVGVLSYTLVYVIVWVVILGSAASTTV